MKRAALLLTVLAACAHVPVELDQARDDYARIPEGANAGEARAALDLATYEYEQHGDTPKARDLTYIARRRVDVANSQARRKSEQQELEAMRAELLRLKAQRAEIEQQAARLPPVPRRAH